MNNPFFLVGTDRSGSTMLRLMVNRHSELAVPNESWFVLDLVRELPIDQPLDLEQVNRAKDLISNHSRWADWNVSQSQLEESLLALESPRLANIIDTVFRLEVGDTARWGDKTPGYVDIVAPLAAMFPNSKFVHITRDARDVCISLLEKKWRGSESWTIARYWRDAVTVAHDQGVRLGEDRYMEVKYEDIVQNTAEELAGICRFLGHEFDPSMLSFHEEVNDQVLSMQNKHHRKTHRPPRAEDIGRWKSELSPLRVAMIESSCAKALDLMGYERHFKGIARVVPLTLTLLLSLSERTLPLRKRFGIHFPGLRAKL